MQNTMHSKNAASTWQLQEVEALIGELKKLLASDINHDENIREELKVLERWEDRYHRDIVTADAFAKTSNLLLTTMHDRLKLDMEERYRLESEGGNPLTKEQAEKNEARLKAMQSIERILNREDHTKH